MDRGRKERERNFSQKRHMFAGQKTDEQSKAQQVKAERELMRKLGDAGVKRAGLLEIPKKKEAGYLHIKFKTALDKENLAETKREGITFLANQTKNEKESWIEHEAKVTIDAKLSENLKHICGCVKGGKKPDEKALSKASQALVVAYSPKPKTGKEGPGVTFTSAGKRASKVLPQDIKKMMWNRLERAFKGDRHLSYIENEEGSDTVFHYKKDYPDHALHIDLKDPYHPKVAGNPNSDGLVKVLESVFAVEEKLELTLDFSDEAFKDVPAEKIEEIALETFKELDERCGHKRHLTSFKYDFKGEGGKLTSKEVTIDDFQEDMTYRR